jgi:hypothetical protein
VCGGQPALRVTYFLCVVLFSCVVQAKRAADISRWKDRSRGSSSLMTGGLVPSSTDVWLSLPAAVCCIARPSGLRLRRQ